MNRVVVLGRGGAGKSALAARLGVLTGLPVIELDKHFWSSDLTPLPMDQWKALQRNLISAERWILDGDLGPYDAPEVRLSAADTVVVLDFALWRCAWRAAPPRPDVYTAATSCTSFWVVSVVAADDAGRRARSARCATVERFQLLLLFRLRQVCHAHEGLRRFKAFRNMISHKTSGDHCQSSTTASDQHQPASSRTIAALAPDLSAHIYKNPGLNPPRVSP